ncbi:SapC family protein [Pseudomaricurvus alkylphenolicus]|jgi:hypothetical protein|uniref:SapC family protein n=1 Tax=Pseudomaricurvus alkylphenolicus TaxID=1306991 RepID=UPI00141E39AB|nr:SapC family protein [Pseudomaricurvus alkylphenolicus]NIB44508.1 SapC family protein [Pseudomaricurvus alkylphenolicus]
MFEKIVPANPETHKGKKIKPITNFDFAKNFNLASVMIHEFSRAAAIYPIVFIEDKGKDQFRPVVLMGLKPDENLFVVDGKWKASYIPAIIRRYPFALAKTDQEDRYTICIDETSDLINDEEGQELFAEDGKPTEAMDRVKTYLGELQQMEHFTQSFCQFFTEKNMFTPLNMRVREENSVKNIAGCYVINEDRLNSLSDEVLLDMRAKRYLAPVYAHLTSLAQIERLLRFKEEQVGIAPSGEAQFTEH